MGDFEALEEELEIQRTLRDLEVDIQKLKEQLSMSLINRTSTTSSISLASTGSPTLDTKSQDQLASFSVDNATGLETTSSKTYFNPDDVFNSDDSFDEEEDGQLLLSQNLILSEANQCPVNKEIENSFKMEELQKYLDAINTIEVPHETVENYERFGGRN